MRVLLLADDCNPDWPSLPVVGFNACRAIASQAEAVVATHVRNRPALERTGMGKAEVVYIDNEYVASPMYKLATFLRGGQAVGWTINVAMNYPSYLSFEWEVWKRFKRELRGGRFDVVHRVTPMSPTLPSPLARWTQVPFVLGPLNGGLKWPAAFSTELKKEKEWLTHLRGAHKLVPYYRSTFTRAKAILAGFAHTLATLPPDAKERTIDFPEVGIDPSIFQAPADRPSKDRVTFLFVGRLVPLKCVDVLISAFAQSPLLRQHRLVVAGDGPEMTALQQQVKENQLQDAVELVGKKPQAEIGVLMRQAEVFAFPSIRELGAGVVVEAMACAMACLVVDYGGPGALIRGGNGIKVPLGPKKILVDHFRREMERLAQDAALRRKLGQKAHRDALDLYSWDAKARKTLEVYQWVLGRGPKPDFYVPSPTPIPADARAH